MGGACSTQGKDEKSVQNFSQNPEGTIPLRTDLGMDGSVILK
jgi:hypothetical protein